MSEEVGLAETVNGVEDASDKAAFLSDVSDVVKEVGYPAVIKVSVADYEKMKEEEPEQAERLEHLFNEKEQ